MNTQDERYFVQEYVLQEAQLDPLNWNDEDLFKEPLLRGEVFVWYPNYDYIPIYFLKKVRVLK